MVIGKTSCFFDILLPGQPATHGKVFKQMQGAFLLRAVSSAVEHPKIPSRNLVILLLHACYPQVKSGGRGFEPLTARFILMHFVRVLIH